tara:strand:+ start:829 stop:1584 length:756 start_codon:yes stop_codon:yes gene_type:complete
MPRIDKEIKNKIIKDIEEGKSLGQISSFTGVSKTTIYYHMRKLLGRKYKLIKLKTDDLELIGEAMGLFAGDGQFIYDKKRGDYKIKIYFNRKDKRCIKYYSSVFHKLIGKKPTLFPSGPVMILQVSSKEFCNFVLNWVKFTKPKVRSIELRKKLMLKNKIFVIGFLRGLIDSDGYVRKGRPEIYFGSISTKLIRDFKRSLGLFNFEYKQYIRKHETWQDYYKIRLSGSEVKRFVDLVKPIKGLTGKQGIEP